ncbi:hypothetical protein C8F04DRAFT_1194157 [Mycena alexandri]|uniref:Uncharacterized protein n=1 Tax=Mycena alexandri TaxID=1745969 RepID=A0AAD6S7T0_9AGAR|nr:hypothetical protein C8F04DRAFT_1194157 [Mycena alexandri]
MATAAVHPIWSVFNHKMVSALTGYLLEPKKIVSATKPELWQAVATAFPVLRYVRQQAEEFNVPASFTRFLHPLRYILQKLDLVPFTWWELAPMEEPDLTPLDKGFEIPFIAPPKLQDFPNEVTYAQAYSISAGRPVEGVDFMSPDNRPGSKAYVAKRAPGAVHLGPPSSTSRSAKVGPPVSTRASTPTPKPKSKAKTKGVVPTPAPTPGAGPSMALRTRAAAGSPSPERPAVSSLKRGRSLEGLARVPSPVPVAKVPAKKRARVKTEEAEPESDHDDRPAGSVVPNCDYKTNKSSVVNALAKALDSALAFKNRISSIPGLIVSLSAEIQANDTGFNVAADVPTDNGLLYVIRTKPKKSTARFFSHISPFSIARHIKSKARRRTSTGSPSICPFPRSLPSPFWRWIWRTPACPLLRALCAFCAMWAAPVLDSLSDPKLCDHNKSIEELVIFHSEIARNYALASDVTEVILSEFVASAKRAQSAGILYREASDDLRVHFHWFIAHVFKCIRLMGTAKFFERFAGAGAPEAVQRHVKLLIEQFNWSERPDATPSDTVPVDFTQLDVERFFSTNFDALESDEFFNMDPEEPFGIIEVGIDETSVPTVYMNPLPTVRQRAGQLRYPPDDNGPSLSRINDAPSDGEVEPEDEEGEAGIEGGDEGTVELEGNGGEVVGEGDVEMGDAGGEILEEDGEEAPQPSKSPWLVLNELNRPNLGQILLDSIFLSKHGTSRKIAVGYPVDQSEGPNLRSSLAHPAVHDEEPEMLIRSVLEGGLAVKPGNVGRAGGGNKAGLCWTMTTKD